MIAEDASTENRLRREIEEDCRRVRMLDTLSEEDKNGKYRNAIKDLRDRLHRNGTDYLSIAIYGRFIVPTTKAFREGFYDGWLMTEDFAALKGMARDALSEGNFDSFLHAAAEMRKVSRQIVLAYGGREEE